ncbi:type II toxin-antitoxin system Phd/YefM family antitoxin [Salana multivorans]
MTTVNVHEAKTSLSRLLARVSEGETITIARAGTPIAKLVPLEAAGAPSRLGFLAGERRVPDDLDTLGAEEIADLFDGEPGAR